MPYVKDRTMREVITELSEFVKVKGDLNYAVCELIGQVILRDGISYSKMSEWIDALPDAEAELRRRILNVYEDKAIIKNGDVESFKIILEKIG